LFVSISQVIGCEDASESSSIVSGGALNSTPARQSTKPDSSQQHWDQMFSH